MTRQQIDGIAREAASSDDLAISDTRAQRRLDHTNFFGLTMKGRKTGNDISASKDDYGPTAKWTENEPCR